MDVAEASFKAVIDSISLEFKEVKIDDDTGTPSSTISGSGSTLIAYCNESTAHQVVEAMVQVFLRNGIECIREVLTADANGADYI